MVRPGGDVDGVGAGVGDQRVRPVIADRPGEQAVPGPQGLVRPWPPRGGYRGPRGREPRQAGRAHMEGHESEARAEQGVSRWGYSADGARWRQLRLGRSYAWDGGLGTARVNVLSQDLTVVVLTQHASDKTGMPAVCADVLSAARHER